MSLYTRARRHIDMDRVKELHEEKKRREEIIRQQQLIIAEIKSIDEKLKCVDWRRELEEGMTTSGMGMLNLEPGGDVDLENVTKTATPGTDGSGGSSGSYSFGSYDETGNAGFSIVLDTTKYDTLKFTAGSGNATRIELSINGGGFSTLSSGTNTITISAANRTSSTRFVFNAFKSDGSGSTGASISGTAFQRRTPFNVVVSLDDPEAVAFMRNGLGGDKERRAKLKDMLDAGNELMIKLGLDPSKTSPGDIELASADALNTPGGVQGGLDKNYTYDPHMNTWVPNISDVERKAAGRKSKFRIDNPLK